jgi:anhydro-N-acetylmuramic acid kinase
MLVIGLMSGTSADGVDAALVNLEGSPPALNWKLIQHVHQQYPDELHEEILRCTQEDSSSSARLCRLNFILGDVFANAALEMIAASDHSPNEVALIGSHGQTVWHQPLGESASTLQIGESAVIAERTGITTIHNFRTRDMAAGGQGAPLTGYTDSLLFNHPTHTRACQNIGGIANVTFLPAASLQPHLQPFAFDTGPGNMLMDAAVYKITHGKLTYDRDGRLAAPGKVNQPLLASWLQNEPFFHQTPPKTTGREQFGELTMMKLRQQAQEHQLNDSDFMATLNALTAHSIAAAYRDFLPIFPKEVIISGGGSYNPVLMRSLKTLLSPARVLTSDDLGLPSAAKEAVAFAVLAYETYHNRPGNLPAATGASHAVVLGSITPGRSFRGLDHG